MFMTPELAAFIIAFKFLTGAAIGTGAAVLLYRSRFRGWLTFRAALFGALAFLLTSYMGGWAGSHAALLNGHRVDFAPWGEDLRLRNFLAENELVLCVGSSVIAALLAGMRLSSVRSS
jgi:hypothetical protein